MTTTDITIAAALAWITQEGSGVPNARISTAESDGQKAALEITLMAGDAEEHSVLRGVESFELVVMLEASLDDTTKLQRLGWMAGLRRLFGDGRFQDFASSRGLAARNLPAWAAGLCVYDCRANSAGWDRDDRRTVGKFTLSIWAAPSDLLTGKTTRR